MSDDTTQDDKDFIEKTEAESKKVTNDLAQKKEAIQASQQNRVKELKNLMPDKERELQESLEKVKNTSEEEKEAAKKEAEEKLERVKTIGTSLSKEVDEQEEKQADQ